MQGKEKSDLRWSLEKLGPEGGRMPGSVPPVSILILLRARAIYYETGTVASPVLCVIFKFSPQACYAQ